MQTDDAVADDIVTATNVDLGNCDREVVHMPGLVQPHGVMLVLRRPDLAILQASENTADFFGVPALELPSKSLTDVLGPDQATAVSAAVAREDDRLDHGPVHLLRLPPADGRGALDAVAHYAGEVLAPSLNRSSGRRPCRSIPMPPLIIASRICSTRRTCRRSSTSPSRKFVPLRASTV